MKICNYCKKEYQPKSHYRTAKFCSSSCSRRSNGRGIKINCLVCDKEVSVCPSEVSQRKFCSLKCSATYKKNGLTKACIVCDESFYVVKRFINRRHCLVCVKLHRSIEKKCAICNKYFRIKNSHSAKRFCCSKKCKNKNQRNKKGELNNNWRGGISTENHLLRSSFEYKQWRKSVFKRDLYRCKRCPSKTDKIEAHHIRSWKDFKDFRFDINNGMTLCVSCHDDVHRIVDLNFIILK